LVLDQLRRLEDDLALLDLARGQTEHADPDEGGDDLASSTAAVADVLALVRPSGGTLPPTEVARRLGLLIQQVEYDGARGKVAITFHAPVLAKVAEALLGTSQETVPCVQH
jgi:hypothetical protein